MNVNIKDIQQVEVEIMTTQSILILKGDLNFNSVLEK